MPSYKQKKQKLRQLVKQEQQQRINKIREKGHEFVDSDLFKREEKHYKYYVHLETDYSEVLKLEDMKKEIIGGYEVYAMKEPEGAYLVKNFIGLKEQYTIGFEALNQYIFRPYRTNLDGTNGLYHENNVHAIKNESDDTETNKKQQYKQAAQQETTQQELKSPEETINKRQKQEIGHQINIQLQNTKILQGIDYANPNNAYYFNDKIRMSNLGYQYDWPHRSYPATRVSIPSTITNLTKKASTLYQAIRKEELTYHGEAVIVNYYKNRDYMTGHLDDGEEDQVNPIFSFCFGLSCVFLIGGERREEKPHAIRLDAGDLMSYSRICYHGVPRIIEDSYDTQNNLDNQQHAQQIEKVKTYIQKTIAIKKEELKECVSIDKRYLNSFEHIRNYYKEHRLNINVRQVWVRKEEEGKKAKQVLEKDI